MRSQSSQLCLIRIASILTQISVSFTLAMNTKLLGPISGGITLYSWLLFQPLKVVLCQRITNFKCGIQRAIIRQKTGPWSGVYED